MGDLRWVAWGLIIVAVDLRFEGADIATDAVGWLVALGGSMSLAKLHGGFQVSAAAAVVGLAAWAGDPWLGVDRDLASLAELAAQTTIGFATCTAIMALMPEKRASADRLRWWNLGLGLLALTLAALFHDEAGNGVFLMILLVVIPAIVVYIGFLVLLFRCARLQPRPPVTHPAG